MEKEKPLVSIITPCYNGENFVHRYFESILKQTYNNVEIIFINDGSTDRTEKIALSYKKQIEEKGYSFHYIYQENAGQASAVNKGLKIFKGEYLTWPDSDDWMSDDCIEKKVEYLEKNPEKGFVLCKTAVINEDDLNTIKGYMYRKNIQNGNIFEDLLFQKDIYFAPGGYMVRSKMFLDVLPTRHIYEGRGGQNWQMLLPIAYRYECGYLANVLYYYLERFNSHSHNVQSYEKMLNALQNYERVKIQSFIHIEMNENKKRNYIRRIKIDYAQKRFCLALEHLDKKTLKKEYKMLKQENALDKKSKQAYLQQNHKILFYLQHPKQLIQDLREKLKKRNNK